MFNDEVKSVGIRFEVAAVSDWIGVTAHEYERCIKTYIAFQIGVIGLLQMQSIARLLCAMSAMTADSIYGLDEHANHAVEFLKILPAGCVSRDSVIEELDEKANRKNHKRNAQRALADFRTYLRFDEIISRYWTSADDGKRIVYFPLYFWWKLTAILPLRPTELLLTPRECLNGKMLTIRRTRLKGGGRRVDYRIDGDYRTYEYEISDHLATELGAYIDATKALKPNEIDTLFVPTESYSGGVSDGSSRYYTYERLCMCLRRFYDEVVTPSGEEIGNISLGDTRHLAMINLIISGGSPTVCRELSGHADIDISSHYYANISSMVECATLEQLRKSKGGTVDLSGKRRYPLNKPAQTHRVQGGVCDSMAVKNGVVSECLKVLGSNGHIGECACCPHYWPDELGVRMHFYNKESGKERVNADTDFLLQMVEIVRRGLGYEEDIGSAIIRLQRSCDHYYKCILENIEHGKT